VILGPRMMEMVKLHLSTIQARLERLGAPGHDRNGHNPAEEDDANFSPDGICRPLASNTEPPS